MTPLEEVRTTGRIGHEGARLLYRLVYSVAVDRNIPAPQGHENWGRAAIEETAHDFLSGSAGMERLVTIANQSNDDDSFRRQLAAAVLNHLRTGGRTTDVGKLVIRLNEILKTTPAFEKIRNGRSNYWAIANGPTDVSDVPLSDLEAELRTMEVIRPKWTSETRDAPAADRSTLIEMLTRVLTRAGGSHDEPRPGGGHRSTHRHPSGPDRLRTRRPRRALRARRSRRRRISDRRLVPGARLLQHAHRPRADHPDQSGQDRPRTSASSSDSSTHRPPSITATTVRPGPQRGRRVRGSGSRRGGSLRPV